MPRKHLPSPLEDAEFVYSELSDGSGVVWIMSTELEGELAIVLAHYATADYPALQEILECRRNARSPYGRLT